MVGKTRGEEGMMPMRGNHEISLESSRWPQLAHGTLALKKHDTVLYIMMLCYHSTKEHEYSSNKH